MKLYEITEQLENMIKVMENHFDVSDEVIEETYEANLATFEEKAGAIASHIKNMQAEASVFKEEAKKLTERAKILDKKVEHWKSYVDINMKRLKLKEVKHGVHHLKYQKGRQVVVITDENKVPSYVSLGNGKTVDLKVKQPDTIIGKSELKKLLDQGIEIEGVSLVRNSDTLQIK